MTTLINGQKKVKQETNHRSALNRSYDGITDVNIF